MAKLVKCKYCEEKFDRDLEEWAQIGKRYVHSSCLSKRMEQLAIRKQEEEIERQQSIKQYHEVFDFVRDNVPKPNYVLVQKQLRDFIDNKGYSYSGIYKTLVYCKDIVKLSFTKGNGGIGIVPYYYDRAKTYYYNLYITNKQNEAKQITSEVMQVKIDQKDTRDKRKRGGFDFLD